MPRFSGRKTQKMLQKKPRNLPEVHTVHHGTYTHPAVVKRSGLKPRSFVSAGGKGVYATHSMHHAEAFGALGRNKKGYIYSAKKSGRWHTEPYKKYVDSQYSRKVVHPTKVTQVRTNHAGQHSRGHSWGVQSGSLPSHVSHQHHSTFHTTHKTISHHTY